MHDLSYIIGGYIDKKIKSKKEKEIVEKLLLTDFKACLEKAEDKEERVSFNTNLKSLQTGKYDESIANAFKSVLSRSTRSKENTRKRIVDFVKYLQVEFGLKIDLDKEFDGKQ